MAIKFGNVSILFSGDYINNSIYVIIVNYVIRPIFPQIKNEIIIDEFEYKEIIKARKMAWDILLVRDFFSYAVRNLLLLESEALKIEHEAKNNYDNFSEQFRNGSFRLENAHVFNLLVMNLLTTCRSYLDLFNYEGKNKKRELFLEEEEIRTVLKQIKQKHHNQCKER